MHKLLLLTLSTLTSFITFSNISHASTHLGSATELVGKLQGSYSVNQGAFNYSIPIDVPAGINGHIPSLSINYNSQSGNGLLGMGFSLSGLSSIHRCAKTIATDGVKGGININENDRLCLDGQRLIAVSGDYWSEGSQYRTEINTYARITYTNNSFKVETKDGNTLYYGDTDDSNIKAYDKDITQKWNVSKAIDKTGNAISYEYENIKTVSTNYSNETTRSYNYISKIMYADSEINFIYENRKKNSSKNYDKTSNYKYFKATLISEEKRLKTIEVNTNLNSIHRYELTYKADADQLNSITKFAQGKALQPITFDWDTLNITTQPVTYTHKPPVRLGLFDDIPIVYKINATDFNNDGVHDLYVHYKKYGDSYLIKLQSNGSVISYAGKENCDSDNSCIFADINGDGASEYIVNTGGSIVVNNYRHYLPHNGSRSLGTFDDEDGIKAFKINSIDYNKDGLDDISINERYVLQSQPNFAPPVRVNFKEYHSSNYNEQYSNIIANKSPKSSCMHDSSNNDGYTYGGRLCVYADVNGDGALDQIENNGGGIIIRNGYFDAVPIISSIANGFNNAKLSINYEINTYSNSNRPFVVVANIEKTNSTNTTNKTSFTYGSALYDRTGRGDLGFDWIESHNEATNIITRKEFSQDFPYIKAVKNVTTSLKTDNTTRLLSSQLNEYYDYQTDPKNTEDSCIVDEIENAQVIPYYRGMPVSVDYGDFRYGWRSVKYLFDNSYIQKHYKHPHNIDSGEWDTLNSYTYKNLFMSTITRRNGRWTHMGHRRHFVLNVSRTIQKNICPENISGPVPIALSKTTTKHYHDTTGELLKTTTLKNSAPDEFGNILSITNTIEDNAGNIWTTQTTNEYDNDTTNWHLARLKSAEVTHSSPNPNVPDITKTSAFTYNADGLLETEVIEPQSDTALTTSYTYDSYGNMTSKTVDAFDIEPRTTSYTYSDDGKHNTTTTNALGHSESKIYDALGRVKSLTGPNGLTTHWEYDALNRKTKETRADGTTTQWRYEYDDSVTFPNGNKSVYKVTVTKNKVSNATYFDAFDNKLRTTSIGFDGSTIIEDAYYNQLGQITKQSLPYYGGDTAHFVISTYDDLGRVTSITKKNDTGEDITSTTSYNGYQTTTTDFNGNSKTTTKNAKDKVIRVDEPLGAYLTHTHDSMGNLIETNANGVVTIINYDNRGNKISMNDPSMGVWSYTYDSLGQLKSQTDAKGQIVTMEYDKLGRMKERQEPEGHTTWIYDTQEKGIGKLARVSSPNLLKTYTYDALGRAHETTTHLNGEEYTVTLGYDEQSRVTTKTHPGGFITENVYNDFGYLYAVRSPKEQVTDYDWEHLRELLEQNQANAQEMLQRAIVLRQQIIVYTQQIQEYKQRFSYRYFECMVMGFNCPETIDYEALNDTELFEHINANIARLENITNQLTYIAGYYQRYAEYKLRLNQHFIALANQNISPDAHRSSYMENINFGIDSAYGRVDYHTGLASCDNQAACENFAQRQLSSHKYAVGRVNDATTKINEITSIISSLTATIELYHANNQALANIDINKSTDETNATHYQDMFADTGNVYFWRAKSRDAANRLTGHLVGNGLSTENTYNPATGNLLTIESGFSDNNKIRDLAFVYDDNQNVLQRNNNALGVQMNYEYDVLDRLKVTYQSTTNTSPLSVQMQDDATLTNYDYDINGNITTKGAKTLEYDNSDYQVSKVIEGDTITDYVYDANGNMTKSGAKEIQYTSHNKPKRFSLTQGTHTQTTQFLYDENRSRYAKIQNTYEGTAHTQIRTTYIGKSYEKITEGDKITHKYFIYNADGKLIATHSKEEDSNPFTQEEPTVDKTNYLHYDNLGSIDTITDGQGNIVQQSEYKPFGEQYRIDTNISQPLLTNRGYTGHEHINEFGFIHMNGRVYDPSIGRFQVADPSVPYVFDSQSYNRYSYTRNNPLKYTDPSGYCDVGDNDEDSDEGVSRDESYNWNGGGGNYFDGEAEEQWYRENVYTDIDIAYNKAFSDGVPGVAPSPSDSSNRTSHYDLFSIEYTLGVRNKYQVAALPQVIVGLGVIGYLSTGKMVNVVGSGAIISISLSQKRSSQKYDTVVIGETMPRVRGYANKHGYGYYNPPNLPKAQRMPANKAWINNQMNKSAMIVDIGVDHSRNQRSDYYEMELDEIFGRSYPNYRQDYQF